jgi:hypothetical protein
MTGGQVIEVANLTVFTAQHIHTHGQISLRRFLNNLSVKMCFKTDIHCNV